MLWRQFPGSDPVDEPVRLSLNPACLTQHAIRHKIYGGSLGADFELDTAGCIEQIATCSADVTNSKDAGTIGCRDGESSLG